MPDSIGVMSLVGTTVGTNGPDRVDCPSNSPSGFGSSGAPGPCRSGARRRGVAMGPVRVRGANTPKTSASWLVHSLLEAGLEGDAGVVDPVDDYGVRGAVGADRGDGLLPAYAPVGGVARKPGWVVALTPLSVDGVIVAASATLLADSRSAVAAGRSPARSASSWRSSSG